MICRAMRVRSPGGLDNLYLGSSEAMPPGPHAVTVRVRASSLNLQSIRRTGAAE
jgi:NADPH:quinone reductase-like Zn-dependent oxidoreductase